MNNSRFWNQNLDTVSNDTKVNKTVIPNKKIIKGAGVTGVILLTLVAIVGFIIYFFVVRPGLALMVNVNALKKDGSEIMESLRQRDLVTLDKTLNTTEEDLARLKQDRDDKFGWAKNLSLFKVSEFYSDSDRLILAGYDGIAALREMEVIVTPFADAAGLRISETEEVSQEQGLMEAFQSWVTIMPQVAEQMDGVITKVAKVGEDLEGINTAKYPENLNGMPLRENLEFVKNTLSKANDYGPDLKLALQIFPRLLAVGTLEKRYMVIMQNDKEIRPTGGFMTNYATFKLKDGLLNSDFTSKDMYSVDLTLDVIDAYTDFPDAPAPYAKYLKVERWYARDMNFSPDFVTSMDQFHKYYKMAGSIDPVSIKPVDGIIAIDTHVVSDLLEVTGPVTVNGITYDNNNVVLELENIASLALREQANRKGVLGNLMKQMLINVFESEKNLWSKLINKGVDLAMRGHIQGYVFDPEAQLLVEKYGLGGRIPEKTEGDYSMVVSTNLGGDKTNWFTDKKVDHTVSKEGNRWVDTVKITYTYNQPSEEFAPFVKRFRDWVRVYAPLGSEFITVEGSEDGTTTDQERNKVWFSGYVEMGPGESKSLTFKYYLPESLILDNNYKLLIQKQAGIDSEIHTVTYNGNTQTVNMTKNAVEVSLKLK